MKVITCLLAATLALMILAGCSNKAVYDNLQHNQRLKCMEQPHAQSVECMNDTSRSYEEYQDDLEQYERERRRIEHEKALEDNQR